MYYKEYTEYGRLKRIWKKNESSCKLPDYICHGQTICLFQDMGLGSFLSDYGCHVSFKFLCMLSEQFKSGSGENFYIHG